MNDPNERNEKCSHVKHDSLLFDDTVMMRVEVFEGDGLNCKSHQGCREEHTKRVFHCERMCFFVCVSVSLHVNKNMQDFAHDKLVEQYNSKQGDKDNDSSKHLIWLCGWIVGIFMLKFNSFNE